MVKFNYKRALEHTTKAESCMDSDHTPQADTERNTTNLNSTSFPKRFVDLLDLQLLLAVIVFFVSGWAYLNSIICGFTGSESINEQMSYILVHYVMSATLCLCLYITYIKGKHVLKLKSDILPNKIYYFHFFLDSWLGILILCLLVIMSSGIGCPWWIWAIILIAALVWKLRRLKFGWMKTLAFTTWVIAMFPVFISTMTLIVKDIEIMTDKHLYSPSDNIYISANGKGYACHHELVGLGNEYLYIT